MRADIVFIKMDNNNQILDMVIVENKLSQGTAFTNRQTETFNYIKQNQSGNNNIEFRSEVKLKINGQDVIIIKGTEFLVNEQKCIKIADHGKPNPDVDTEVTFTKI